MGKVQSKVVKPHVAGCGTRRVGKTYIVSNIQKRIRDEHIPFGYFICDPPILINNPADFGICPQGISFAEMNGVMNVFDWIGANNYPNAADILEEAFAADGSSLVPLTAQLDKLIPGVSKRFLVHPHGWLVNNQRYKHDYVKVDGIPLCFRHEGDQQHVLESINEPCASLHWQVIEGGASVNGSRGVIRKIGDHSYSGIASLADEPPQFKLAIIGWLPIDEINLIDTEEKSDLDKALNILSKFQNMPVYITNA